jgi:hypothetical protein
MKTSVVVKETERNSWGVVRGEGYTDTKRSITNIEPFAGGRKAIVRFQLPDGCPTLSGIMFNSEEIVQSINVGDTIHLLETREGHMEREFVRLADGRLILLSELDLKAYQKSIDAAADAFFNRSKSCCEDGSCVTCRN